MVENKIIVVDFGGQYAHLIARRIRELGVFSEIVQVNAPLKKFKEAKGIILSGSPLSICDLKALNFNKKILFLGKPLLGICYGHQLIARELNGKIRRSTSKEFGKAKLKIHKKKGIFYGLKDNQIVWMSHHDEVSALPKNFEVIGSTNDCKIAAMANFKKKIYGFQFHPEVTHTKQGKKMLENFLFKECKAKKNWTMKNLIKEKINEIKEKTKNKNVLMFASGGVDSTVALALLSKALPKNKIFAFHFDTGFMRKNESIQVKKELERLNLAEIKIINARKAFFNALKNVCNPEKKRKIIGKLYIQLKNKELKKLKLNPKEWLLCQGTIYPDTIETAGTKLADKIKTHHNRAEEVIKLIEKGHLIEPLADLYKDEVRELGLRLGLSKNIIFRQPFPGPGLAIRALCSKRKLKAKQEKEINEFLKQFKSKAIVLPLKSVGVQGDLRTYRKPLILMTKEKNYKKLEELSTLLTNKFSEINRVILAVKPEKITKIKLLKRTLTPKRIKLLQEADAIASNEIIKAGLKRIWQMPVVLLPIAVNDKKGESIVLRPIESKEAMTAKFYLMPLKTLKKITKKILSIKGINAVFYDITHKPPATIEWE